MSEPVEKRTTEKGPEVELNLRQALKFLVELGPLVVFFVFLLERPGSWSPLR